MNLISGVGLRLLRFFFVIKPHVYVVKCSAFNVFTGVAHTSVSCFRTTNEYVKRPALF